MNIAIVIIGYNRIDSISRLTTSLNNAIYNDDVDLIFSIDKSETDIVGKFADNFEWKYGNKRVKKHSKNLGLRKHILSIGEYFAEYEALIILEDDIIVSKNFYLYAKSAISEYIDDCNIAGISLYNYSINQHTLLPFLPIKFNGDTYFMQYAQSWGQIWLKKQWIEFIDWYNSHNEEFIYKPHLPKTICDWPKSSWLKYHTKYCIENDKYFVYPYQSYTSNSGDCGTHYSFSSSTFQVPFSMEDFKKPVFSKFMNEIIIYDAFFENRGLSTILSLDNKELCIDLHGEKNNEEGKQYWLTTRKENYRILRTYGLTYYPIDLNIILEAEGDSIYLYDTSVYQNNRNVVDKRKLYNYIHRKDVLAEIREIRKYGIGQLCGLIMKLFIKKVFKQ